MKLRRHKVIRARLVDYHGPDGIWEVWFGKYLLFASTRKETAAEMVEKINLGREVN